MSYSEDVKEVMQIRIVIDGGMVDTVDAFADSLSGIVGRTVEIEVVDRDVEDNEDSGIYRIHLVTKEKKN